ncbi:CmpA/NrtA family ABC transporter substrate-binding protein [Telmatospirillum siberiense]|uniref:Nitrate ABC transporter n=1 Tax=Telmatospirillum siberiense TaxID=382514 RepID=A0A2N3PMT1_9PROT|nr:CmpA/NrtA family ABC transporter substrate-binding protein [Telmatospirillum siberiense]PKU21704.1 nitrate ABC transporter [Telmatospirillum siberiense]
MALEKTRLRLGIVPLCDCAPIVVARERGFFAEQGLDVEIAREPSWANIRDKVLVGALDGAQMLAPMPFATTLGLGNVHQPIVTAFGLNIGGNAITVSNALFDRMMEADPDAMAERPLTARALKAVIERDRAAGAQPMTFAMVYPFSSHHYELRGWMAAAGIDPDRDVRLVVVPPPQMVANLSAGNIEGYCVGEPWNAMASSLGLGRVLITSQELWGGRVEKVLGVAEGWADAHPETHKALIRALLLASRWTDQPENRAEVARIVAQPPYVNAPQDVVRATLEQPGALIFSAHAANFPWRSQALWFLVQMRRWGQLPATVDMRRAVDRVFRSDLYRLAALELDIAVPLIDAKTEGDHRTPWTLAEATRPIAMGPDAFFDGGRFDPAEAETLANHYARSPLSAALRA